MSSSSAYSNVLLKSPVQAQTASVQKRDYQDDQLSTSFQQHFQDVRESVRNQDEPVARATPKKAAPTSANNHDKKSPQVHKADKNDSRDNVSKNEKSSDANEKVADQNADEKASIDKDSDSKTAAKKTTTDDDQAATASAEPVVATNPNTAPASPVGIAIAQIGTAESGTEAEAETTAENLIAPTGKTGVLAGDSDKAGDTKNGLTTLSTVDQTKVEKSGSDKVGADTDISLANAQIAAANTQTQPSANVDAAAGQAPGILAGAGVVQTKPATDQVTAPTDDATEADSLSLLANPPEGGKSSAKTVAATDVKVATSSDSAPTQILDTKSSFEKALQNLVHSESSGRDESTSLSAAQTTSSTTSSTNVLDAMQRFSDAQTPAARSFVVQTAVPVPVGQPQWSQAVGEKVLWLAAQNVSAAEIHLNPENLGPMQVKVSVNQDQTTVNFTSHHPVVREVLDQNMGRLRDMFSEQGLNLVNVDVSDKSFSRQQGDSKDQKGQANTNDVNVEEEAPVAMTAIVQKRLVDHYA